MTTRAVLSAENESAISISIWSKEVILLLTATFLAYSNIAVFFQFYGYLRTLPINPKWFGLLIGIFSAVCLVVRPVISSLFHAANARRYLFVGTALVAAALFSYGLAKEFWSMLLVRAFHGLGFVILGTALMAMTVHYIPRERSGQAFGFLAVIILIPNTFVPLLLPFLTKSLGSYTAVLGMFALITVLVLPIIKVLRNHPPHYRSELSVRRLTRRELIEDLKDPRILVILTAMLFLYSTYALIFFFLDGYGRSIGIGNAGFFLTLAMASEIGIRIGAGSFFDRTQKNRLAAVTMAGLALSYLALGYVSNLRGFLLLGILVGLGWGVAMPVFNGLMFDTSEPRFRSFNVNLGLQIFQAGLFIGPFIGGPVVSSWGFTPLFHLCAFMSLASAGLVFFLRVTRPQLPKDSY